MSLNVTLRPFCQIKLIRRFISGLLLLKLFRQTVLGASWLQLGGCRKSKIFKISFQISCFHDLPLQDSNITEISSMSYIMDKCKKPSCIRTPQELPLELLLPRLLIAARPGFRVPQPRPVSLLSRCEQPNQPYN